MKNLIMSIILILSSNAIAAPRVPETVTRLLVTAWEFEEGSNLVLSGGKGLEITCSSSYYIQEITDLINDQSHFALHTYAYNEHYASIESMSDFFIGFNGDLILIKRNQNQTVADSAIIPSSWIDRKFANCDYLELNFDETFERIK